MKRLMVVVAAAEQGDVEAQYHLGWMCYSGDGAAPTSKTRGYCRVGAYVL